MPNHALQEAGFTPTDQFTEIRRNFDCFGTDPGLMQIELKTVTLLLVASTLIQCEHAA